MNESEKLLMDELGKLDEDDLEVIKANDSFEETLAKIRGDPNDGS